MTVRGTVKGNTIVLDDGACLPEGATVEVRVLPQPRISREEAFARFWEQRAANADLCLNVDELIEEDRQEREGMEFWTSDERLCNALVAYFPFVRFLRDYKPLR